MYQVKITQTPQEIYEDCVRYAALSILGTDEEARIEVNTQLATMISCVFIDIGQTEDAFDALGILYHIKTDIDDEVERRLRLIAEQGETS